jgi:hypothetical protein
VGEVRNDHIAIEAFAAIAEIVGLTGLWYYSSWKTSDGIEDVKAVEVSRGIRQLKK